VRGFLQRRVAELLTAGGITLIYSIHRVHPALQRIRRSIFPKSHVTAPLFPALARKSGSLQAQNANAGLEMVKLDLQTNLRGKVGPCTTMPNIELAALRFGEES
jgi:hypothetical protein